MNVTFDTFALRPPRLSDAPSLARYANNRNVCGADFGYWMGEPFWGRGIATQAARAVSEEAFLRRPELMRLQASVYGWNPASARVLEKAGFQREGVLRQSVFRDGVLADSFLYARIR